MRAEEPLHTKHAADQLRALWRKSWTVGCAGGEAGWLCAELLKSAIRFSSRQKSRPPVAGGRLPPGIGQYHTGSFTTALPAPPEAANKHLTAVPSAPVAADENGIAIRTSYDKGDGYLYVHKSSDNNRKCKRKKGFPSSTCPAISNKKSTISNEPLVLFPLLLLSTRLNPDHITTSQR